VGVGVAVGEGVAVGCGLAVDVREGAAVAVGAAVEVGVSETKTVAVPTAAGSTVGRSLDRCSTVASPGWEEMGG